MVARSRRGVQGSDTGKATADCTATIARAKDEMLATLMMDGVVRRRREKASAVDVVCPDWGTG